MLGGVLVSVRGVLLQQKLTAKLCSVDPEDLQLVSGHRRGEAITVLSKTQTKSYLLLLETESERKD